MRVGKVGNGLRGNRGAEGASGLCQANYIAGQSLGCTNSPYLCMKAVTPRFPCPIDDLVPIARLLRVSYERDHKELAALLPDDYTPAFLNEYDPRLAAAEVLVSSLAQRATGMLYTARIQELYKTLPELLNFLQARVRRVEAPTVSVKAFGIEAARKARNADNQSGLEAALKRVLQNVAANAAGLAKKGQQPADTQKLQDVYDALVDDTTNQGASMSTQKNLTQDNLGVLNHLFEAMQHLLADGKALYAASNRAKAQDYAMSQLMKKVGQSRPARPVLPGA